MYVAFDKISDQSRIWLYQADRKLSDRELELVRQELKSFCEGWNVHGNGILTSFEILEDQVIVLAADESQSATSGCSIDSSVRALQRLENLLQINLTDRGKVAFKESGQIRIAPALGIRSKVQEGSIVSDTPVMNPLIQTKADLNSLWIPAAKSWLNKYFPN
ncbi:MULTISPECIES: hypothetical protein [Algoriphagus]|uniref:ABC transporter ATPase n=2 Tax=Algoriphagus TaxID=246875 RepID=A0A4Y9QR91_9BACT|nr:MULTISPECIES: hypothetical protein [Algoriphagus]MCS5491423.1 hypothetical protein [Algoriphagus limi]TFV93523.1 hypothetical protein E4S40_14855 [Algoriphagus kandeliae]